jgi:membrane-bound metal-dependent hydrolase YbcI (DUF457 family)
MMARTHQLGGVALWLGVTVPWPVSPVVVLAGMPVAAFAALWPDLDHPQAKLARSLGPVTYVLSVWVERRFGGHRAGTHSLLVGPPLCAILAGIFALGVGLGLVALTDVSVAIVGPLVAIAAGAAFVGALSHSLLDCLTCNCGGCDWKPRRTAWDGRHKAGVELWWPIVKRRYGLPVMPVGGSGELMVARPLLVVLAAVGAVFTVMGWAA